MRGNNSGPLSRGSAGLDLSQRNPLAVPIPNGVEIAKKALSGGASMKVQNGSFESTER